MYRQKVSCDETGLKKLGDNLATRTLMTFWGIICYILDRNRTFKQLAALN